MSYRFNQKTVKNILTDFLSKNSVNKDLVIEGIIKCVNDSTIEYLIDILSKKDRAVLIYPKDYVMIDMNVYDIDKKFNYDTLKEMGLLCAETNSVYGKVIGDNSWLGDYNPYYGSLKVSLFYHDENGNMLEKEEIVNTVSVRKIEKEDIPYFKSLNKSKK